MSNQFVKNLSTLIKDKGEKPKDQKLNNLDIALRLSRLNVDKRSVILANNRVGTFFQAKSL